MSDCAIRRCSSSSQAECGEPAGRTPRSFCGNPETVSAKVAWALPLSNSLTSCFRMYSSFISEERFRSTDELRFVFLLRDVPTHLMHQPGHLFHLGVIDFFRTVVRRVVVGMKAGMEP